MSAGQKQRLVKRMTGGESLATPLGVASNAFAVNPDRSAAGSAL
jgi:hypothetical protein